jgi:hypothetical protein
MCPYNAQVPPRQQLEDDSSQGSSKDGDALSRPPDSSGSASWQPPPKREKQKRKGGGGGGWFDGANVTFSAEAGEAQGGADQSVDDFNAWGDIGTFQKRKPRALGSLGLRSQASAAAPSAPKVNTHFMAGTGVRASCNQKKNVFDA